MTALADIPRACPARPANEARPPLSAADRRALIETEALAGAIEDLDHARRRDRAGIDDVMRLTQAPTPTMIEITYPESESLEYRIMSGLSTFMGAAAIITIAVFALSLLADLPGLLTREVAP